MKEVEEEKRNEEGEGGGEGEGEGEKKNRGRISARFYRTRVGASDRAKRRNWRGFERRSVKSRATIIIIWCQNSIE